MISFLIRQGGWNQVLVFARTRYGADKLTEELIYDGIKAAAIHSNKSQSIRTRTLAEFKQGAFRVLVATDVAARGLDIERLPHVVNYDLPQVPEDYVHRIGRTGRAGENGVALSLVSSEEKPLLAAIERLLTYKIPRQILEEFPVTAARRSARVQALKKEVVQVKARKKQDKAAQDPARKTAPRRKKVVPERPTPKTGRRGSRS
jgi:ATP-dependent RNA helicase RhlE